MLHSIFLMLNSFSWLQETTTLYAISIHDSSFYHLRHARDKHLLSVSSVNFICPHTSLSFPKEIHSCLVWCSPVANLFFLEKDCESKRHLIKHSTKNNPCSGILGNHF